MMPTPMLMLRMPHINMSLKYDFCIYKSRTTFYQFLTIQEETKRKEKRTRDDSKLTIFQNQNYIIQRTNIIHQMDEDGQILQNSTITIFQIRFTTLTYR